MALDLADLEAELSRTRRKAVDWSASRMQLASDRNDQHNALMRDQADKLNNLQGVKAQLQVAVEQTHKRLRDEEQEMQLKQAGLASASAEANTAEKRLEASHEQFRRQQDEYRRQVTDLEDGLNKKQRQLDYLRRSVTQFRDRFSLRFRQGQDELCLVMTHVDTYDHMKEYCLSVRIMGDVYQVTRCDPAVPGLEELTAEVNRTNDFAVFLKAVRAGFVHVAQQSHGL